MILSSQGSSGNGPSPLALQQRTDTLHLWGSSQALGSLFFYHRCSGQVYGLLIYHPTHVRLTADRLNEFLCLKRLFPGLSSAQDQVNFWFTTLNVDFPFVTISALAKQLLFLLSLSHLCAKPTCCKQYLIAHNEWITGLEHVASGIYWISFATERYEYKTPTILWVWNLFVCPAWAEIQTFTIQHLPGFPSSTLRVHHITSPQPTVTNSCGLFSLWKISNAFRKQIAVYH